MIPPKMEMERVTSMIILGVSIRDDLDSTNHVEGVITSCLRLLCTMSIEALRVVTQATTIARWLYAAPAWWCLSLAKDPVKLDRFQKHVKRLGFLQGEAPSVTQ